MSTNCKISDNVYTITLIYNVYLIFV